MSNFAQPMNPLSQEADDVADQLSPKMANVIIEEVTARPQDKLLFQEYPREPREAQPGQDDYHHADLEEGSTVPHRFPGSILLATHLILSLVFTLVTTVYTYSSRYRGMQRASSILPPQPHQALIIIQLLMTISVKYMLQCFLICCDRLRWVLAAGGTPALIFHILGAPTGFWALFSLSISKPGKGSRLQTWRLIALFKILVIHIILIAAQLIWLLGINPQTVYGPSNADLDWVSRPGFGQGVGDFTLLQGEPLPFAPWRVFGYLSDVTSVIEIEPISCNTATDLHCAAYMLMGFSGLVIPNPDHRPHNGGESAAIINDIPAYIVEFSSGTKPTALTDPEDPWVNCANSTSKVGSSIQLCLGLESSPTLSSRVSAGWEFCLEAENCTGVYDYTDGSEAYNNTVFKTTMDIYKSNVSMIIDVYNGTILDVYSIGKRSPYAVNQTDFFTAFLAPFNYAPVNVTNLLASDYIESLAAVQSSNRIFLNNLSPAEIKAVNDGFLDSLIWSFTSPLPSESPALHLRGFLSYALAVNSGFYYQPVTPSAVRQTYVLNVKTLSLLIYTGLNISVWLCSVGMLFYKPLRVIPNTTAFSDLSFESLLRGDGNMDTGSAIEQLANVRYFVGEHKGRVVLSKEESLPPLINGVAYLRQKSITSLPPVKNSKSKRSRFRLSRIRRSLLKPSKKTSGLLG